MSISLEALVGISPRRFAALFGPVLGKLPPVKEIPRPRLPRWKVTRLMVPATVAMLRRVNASQKRLPEFVAAAPSRCDQLRADIEQTTDAASLPRLWQDRVRPLIEEACDMLSAAAAHGTALVTIPGKLIARWTSIARDRETARSEVARSVWVARAWVRRAGQLTGHGDDLFFLELPETVDLLCGDPASLAKVPARRVSYQTYRALPPYPALIRGRFDPVRWAADPNRRGDYYDENAQTTKPDDTITGFPGAAGVVEGIARVLRAPEDAAQFGDGEILVTTVTNIGWTPIFPRAAAVVTDVGAPLSHAAIVARELGIPAVVGCGNATMLLHSGDRVRVDGSNGTVEVLHRRR